MVGHDGEAVKTELALIAIAEKRGDEEFSVLSSLEVPVAAEGQDGDGIGAEFLSGRGHS